MREILYLQAGKFSNYVGTHFWNTQDAYHGLNTGPDSQLDHQISFTERRNSDGNIISYPRAILFDCKENFGTLAQSNALMGIDTPHATDLATEFWDQSVNEIRQSRVPRSQYHTQLENSPSDGIQLSEPGEIRYWSDFSHVYYLPRSIQQIPRTESQIHDWKQSQDQFRRYNEDNDLMDTSVRLFLEESDSIQGVQLLADVPSFGGFSDALLTQLGDEFMKLSTLVFPILVTGGSHAVDVDDVQGTRRIINEALYLRSMQEHATLSIPVSAPENWSEKAWRNFPAQKLQMISRFQLQQSPIWSSQSPYFSSSIIAAHVESVTFSVRTNASQDRMHTYGAQLSTINGNPGFAEISGVIPVGSSTNFGHCLANLTNTPLEQSKERVLYSARDVIRGFDSLERRIYTDWKNATVGHLRPATFSYVEYPLTGPLHTALSSDAQPLDSTHMLSRLSTSNGLAQLFKGYASFMDASLGRRTAGMMSMGIDVDEIREVVNDLWNIHDSFPADNYDDQPIEMIGSDEE